MSVGCWPSGDASAWQPFVSRRIRVVPGQLGTRAPLMGTLARAALMTRVVEVGL